MSAIPVRFRAPIRDIVQRLVDKDFEGLVRDGVVVGGGDVGYWTEDYPATLSGLPDEAWAFSEAGLLNGSSSSYWFVLDLWTVEEGRSDLSMEGEVREAPGSISVLVHDVHVL